MRTLPGCTRSTGPGKIFASGNFRDRPGSVSPFELRTNGRLGRGSARTGGSGIGDGAYWIVPALRAAIDCVSGICAGDGGPGQDRYISGDEQGRGEAIVLVVPEAASICAGSTGADRLLYHRAFRQAFGAGANGRDTCADKRCGRVYDPSAKHP